MSKDFYITLLIIIGIMFLAFLITGCVGKERTLTDTCICDCKDQRFECYRDWKRDDLETKINTLSIPVPAK